MQGRIFRRLVEESGKQKQDIAQELGVTKSYLSRLFKLDTIPDATLFRIKDVFGVDKDFFDKGEQPKPTDVEKRMEELEQRMKAQEEENRQLRKLLYKVMEEKLS